MFKLKPLDSILNKTANSGLPQLQRRASLASWAIVKIMAAFSIGGILLLTNLAYAVPAAPIVHTLTQADGTTFQARRWGDERAHGMETIDGYSIVFDENSQNWMYAIQDDAGRLVPSSNVVGEKDIVPSHIPQHLRPNREASQAKEMLIAFHKRSTKATVTQSDTVKITVLLEVESTHVGKTVDTLIVAFYQNKKGDTLGFMRNGMLWTEWDSNMETLLAAQKNVKLSQTQEIEIFRGNLPMGTLTIYVTYRLNRQIVFNNLVPIEIVVQ